MRRAIAAAICTAIPIASNSGSKARSNSETGFVIDFFDIEKAFAPLHAQLDHHCLNEIAGLENPTAENIAVWIYEKIRPALPQLAAVTVFETRDCYAEYEGR